MADFLCGECGSDLVTGTHAHLCRKSWPKRGRRFSHATETRIAFPGAEPEPVPCEITRVVHQSCVWYRTPTGRRAIAYADFASILGEWLS